MVHCKNQRSKTKIELVPAKSPNSTIPEWANSGTQGTPAGTPETPSYEYKPMMLLVLVLVLVLLLTVCNALDAVYIDESPCIGEDSGILISSFRSPPGLLLQLQSIGVVAPSGGMTLNNNLPAKYLSFVQKQGSDGLLAVHVVALNPFNTSNRVSESFLMNSRAMNYHNTRSMANQLSLPLIWCLQRHVQHRNSLIWRRCSTSLVVS